MPRLQSTANAFHEVLELRGMSATHLVNPPTGVHHVNCSTAPTKVYAPGTLQATFPAPALRTLSHQPQRGQLSSYRARHALNRMALSRTVSNLVSHLVVQEMTIPLQSKPSVRRFALPHRLLWHRRWSTPRQPRTQVVGCAYGGMRTHTKRAPLHDPRCVMLINRCFNGTSAGASVSQN